MSEPRRSHDAREDVATEFDSVLIYDGDCPFCSAAASALRRLDGAGAIPWADGAARAFLDAQFGEAPFALVYVDRPAETVWIGREAARELCERAGVPTLIGDVVADNYESVADAVRTATGVDRDPDPYHGTAPLADGAADAFPDVADRAYSTHRPASDGRPGDRRSGDRHPRNRRS